MKTKLIILLLFINLFSCKKTEENQPKTYNKKINELKTKGKENAEFNFDKFLISKGKVGEIKIGMNLNDAENSLREMNRKKVEAYDFGYDGGGNAFIYSIKSEAIIALIPNRDTTKIIAIIAISNKLKTDNGLNPKSNIIDILKRYPKMEVSQDLMTENEYMYDENKKWSFIFLTDESNRIGEYKDIDESAKPKRLEAKMDYIEIK
ncbi:hypothetical protein SGQ83_07925 [Flavobacterium sp. Fl-318]|uniref:Lipoprotein n=1 Tax=Flavobacterium cupriresistens TaxID=2893885 RepID=A0ABU4R9N4_9FLAO|nr:MULTISPECIES: hypothetical protein [unclassified Flavobacterium]MDX6189269.1 hypothetical protein [Flavobacterium sp. Fl-318]UFH41365.1 hypothetical protein LNP23_16295 [Flavobacterium sp. F-323]